MAIDVSNRNPQDPNGIYSFDTTAAMDAWVKDGDWSQVYYDQAAARKAGATNKVRIATAITNDGKKYDVVIGADGAPISQIGDVRGQDDDVANRWKQNAPKPLPPGGSPTQNRNGRVYGYNPQTGQYDVDQGAVPQVKPTNVYIGTNPTTGKPTQISEYPDPSAPGGVRREYDDTQVPASASTAPPGGKAYIDEEGPTGRRLGWNPETKAYDRDLGSSPSAQAAARGQSAREPVKDHPGVYVVKTTKDGQTETHYENEAGERIPTPAGLPTREERQYQHDDGKTYTQVTTDDGKGNKRQFFVDASGKEVTLPAKGTLNLPAGAPEVDLSSPEAAYSSVLRYHTWLDSQFRQGKLTAQQVKDAYEPAHRQAEMVINKAKDERAQKQQEITNLLTQRSQDISQTGNRLSNSTSQFQTAQKEAERVGQLADPGIGAATNTLFGTMALQRLFANQNGGLADAPPVVVPGPVANLPPYQSPLATAPGQTPAVSPVPAVQAATTAASAAAAQATAAGRPATPVAAPSRGAEPPARANIPSAVRPPVSTAAEPPARANIPAAVARPPVIPGLESPDDILTLQDANGYQTFITRANYDRMDPAAREAFPVVNAENAAVFAARTGGGPNQAPDGATQDQFTVMPPSGAPAMKQDTAPIFPMPNQTPVDVPYPDNAGAVSRAMPTGMPTMALASSMSGQGAYDPAIQALKAAGLDDATIQRALSSHMAGAAA